MRCVAVEMPHAPAWCQWLVWSLLTRRRCSGTAGRAAGGGVENGIWVIRGRDKNRNRNMYEIQSYSNYSRLFFSLIFYITCCIFQRLTFKHIPWFAPTTLSFRLHSPCSCHMVYFSWHSISSVSGLIVIHRECLLTHCLSLPCTVILLWVTRHHTPRSHTYTCIATSTYCPRRL